MPLDVGTVLFSTGLIGLVLVLFSWTLALTPRAPRWRLEWASGNTSLLVGVALYLGQGSVSPWISVVLANGLVILGYHLLELGVRRFAQRPPRLWAGVLIASVFAVTFVAFTFVWNLYAVRVVVYSVLVVAVWWRILRLLPILPERQVHPGLVRGFQGLAVLILISQAGRAVVALGENGQSLLAPSQALALMLLVSVLVIVAWSLGFITLELTRSHRHLEHALEGRDKMIRLIAHDLRGALGGQVGLLGMLRSQEKSKEEERELLHLLSDSAQASFDLLENLLDWAQHQRGTFLLHPEPLEGRAILEQALEPYLLSARTKGIVVTFTGDTGPLRTDRRALATILRNLLSNAVKFTPAGGTISLGLVFQPPWVEFVVRDSGVGLSDAQRELWNRGSSLVSTEGTAQEMGTGLGLTLCRDFAQLLGGKLTFEYQESGALARLVLPQEGP